MFVFSEMSKPAVGPGEFSIQWDFPGVRRPKREGDLTPLSSAEIGCVEQYLYFPTCLNGFVFINT